MFEPLPDVIRLRRIERNLSQERLSKLAGVSRGQLALLEAGENVSLLFLLKVARALELTELPIAELRLRAAPPELGALVIASDVVKNARRAVGRLFDADQTLEEAETAIDNLLSRAFASAGPSDAIEAAVNRLETIPQAEQEAAGHTLRELAGLPPTPASESDPRPEPQAVTRKRAR